MPTSRVATAAGLAGLATTVLVHAGTLRARSDTDDGKPSSRRAPDTALSHITVVIAGRDEIKALPALIRDLGLQDHRELDGRPAFDVVVVDDRSTDGTGAATRRAADAAGIGEVTRVVRRHAGARPDGKRAALAAVSVDIARGAAVFVLGCVADGHGWRCRWIPSRRLHALSLGVLLMDSAARRAPRPAHVPFSPGVTCCYRALGQGAETTTSR